MEQEPFFLTHVEIAFFISGLIMTAILGFFLYRLIRSSEASRADKVAAPTESKPAD